jgi:uncharacterized membrane protein YbaN (DUF454 family)
MFARAVVLAVRYRKVAKALVAIGIVGLVGAMSLMIVLPSRLAVVSPAFPLFLGIAMFGWGAVLVSSWFGPAARDWPRKTGAARGFAARAFHAYLAAFAFGWLSVAIGLIAVATTIFVLTAITKH